MRIPTKLSRVIVLGAISLAGVGAESPSNVPLGTVWGQASNGIQCGLGMLPSQSQGRIYLLRFTVRNVGSSTVSFTDGEIRKSVWQLVDVQPAGKISRPWSSDDGEDPLLNLPPLKPGETTGVTVSTGKDLAGKSVTYDGSLTPIGAKSSIPLRCGPINF